MVLSRHARSLWVGFVSLAVSFSATRSEAQDAQNIAALGVATQSTQLGGFAPGLAIDGNLGNFTHTLAGNNGSPVVWWQLDFGEPTEFEQIILHNRGDGCCQSRFRDLTVFVLDDPQILQDAIAGDPALTVADLPDILDDAIIFQSDLLNAENVDGGGGTAGPAMLDSGLAEVIEGQVIVVTRTPDPDNSGTGGQGNNDESDVLSIGEIEVLGTIDCPAEGDTHCTGIEILPPLDEGPGAYQVTAFGEDDSGDPVSYTFTFEGPNGELNVVGPTQNNVVTATLSTGEWTVAVLVDDVPFCDDVADDAECVEEIEVRESENLALGKPATQSSQLGGFGPNLAVDGNPGNFTHTAANQNLPSTWQVDLGRESDISFINIFNRTSCCGSRLRDITVQILDIDLETVVFETPLMNPENVLGAFPLGPTNLGVDLLQLAGEPIAGFGVRVIRTPDPDNSGTGGQGNADEANVLSIGELEVYELADDCADDADTTCDAMTITGPEDDGPGLYTVVIEGSDGSGDAVTYSLLAENEAGDAQYVGHSDLGNLALELTSGTWTIRAFVDDNPRCPDQSENAICEQVIEVGSCPEGDTHCEDLLVDGPSDSGPGVYTFTAIAEDDSLDPIQYQFSLEPDGGAEVVSPFQDADSIQFVLSPGIWTVRVLAVDNIDCIENEAKDSICETTVEVDEAGENVALGKVTDQSSEYNGGQFPAGFAVDGNFGNFTHTLAGNDALGPAIWEVDLGEDFAIGRVVLHNRASCCGSRLRDVIVSVHDISFREDEALDPLGLESTDYPEPVWPDSIIESELLNAENELAGGDVGAVPAIEADFGGEGVVGRFIRVTRLPDTDLSGTGGVGNADEATVLSLGEVEVYLSGDPVECPQEGEAEFGDTACSGVDASGPAGNGEGTWTFTANATDATDDTIRYEFRAERLGDGASQTRGPSSSNTATFDLTEGDWTITVNVDDDRACDDDGGQTECDVQVTVVGDDPVEIFHRGDGNNSGTLDLTDGILVLNFLFTGGAAPVCFDAADTNDSGALELTDAVVVFGYLFTGGAPPADPGPVDQPCGPDPTGDDLDCATYTNCGN